MRIIAATVAALATLILSGCASSQALLYRGAVGTIVLNDWQQDGYALGCRNLVKQDFELRMELLRETGKGGPTP